MTDAPARQALQQLLAGQARAEAQRAALLARLDATEAAQRQVLAVVLALQEGQAALREATERLAEAANAEPRRQGRDLAAALRRLAKVVAEGNVTVGRAAIAVETLPDLLEQTALRAVLLAQGEGVAPP